jgi:hypothetical protein
MVAVNRKNRGAKHIKRHPRQLLKRRKKLMARRPYATDHEPAFWFKRKTAEIRAAQMEKYRQKRLSPSLYQHIIIRTKQ